jgi:plasmid stabilization system protein ParE
LTPALLPPRDRSKHSSSCAFRDSPSSRVGRVLNETGVRELVVVRYPYKVYYEIAGDEIRVLHIRDARRRPWQNN